MKLFIAGGSGAIGMRLVPALVAQGHEVAAMTRTERNAAALAELGARPVLADALDRTAVIKAVVRIEPEVIIHQLTSLTGVTSVKNFDKEFALTNRLRTEGADHLLAAAVAAGTHRLISGSYAGWTYERIGSAVKREQDPFDPSPPRAQKKSLAAIRHLEQATLGTDGIEGIVLRYASFYGPGTSYAADGEITELVRKRAFPIVGNGAGIWSFVHIDDAVGATLAAINHAGSGIFNIADDEPAPVAEWLPHFARVLEAKPPRQIPVWLGRLAAGEVGVSMLTQIRGVSNAWAKRELGWSPRHPSWRQGFAESLGQPSRMDEARAGTVRQVVGRVS